MKVRIQIDAFEDFSKHLLNVDLKLAQKIVKTYVKQGRYILLEIDSETLEAILVKNKD